MLASLADAPLVDPQLIYEPKYDGIRAIVVIDGPQEVRLWSRLGNEKTAQFPEIVRALQTWARRRSDLPLVLDGEVVALDEAGNPAGFQRLQGRIHLSRADSPGASLGPTALIVFDVLRDGHEDYRERPLAVRRVHLEKLLGRVRSPLLRLSESVRGDGRALYKRAIESGWEGLIVKHADSRYRSGKRSPDWRKLKLVQEQEFVIGGWTEPRHTRSYFGALALGVYDGDALVYAGQVGTGFDQAELARLMARLQPLESKTCPFHERPKTNERPHWVRPTLIAQVKFTEWTADGILRHPVYLGLRDDKKPGDVRREVSLSRANARAGKQSVRATTARPRAASSRSSKSSGDTKITGDAIGQLVDQLQDLETAGKDGVLDLPDGDQVSVTNLRKIFWPKSGLTKGDLFRYYAQAAPYILPVVQDRPLTMKRLPNGIAGAAFYQHRAPEYTVPKNIRVEQVANDDVPSRFIGGNLKTLLYMTQLAAISQDPWFSRVQSLDSVDHVALDLDPPDGVPFGRVLDIARWIHDELNHIGITGFPKTSGADGIHIYIPMPAGIPYDAGLLFCQIIATVVAQKHPEIATVERHVKSRGARVYVDYLQNIRGKTLATAYSARASEWAGVSTPLSWKEIHEGFSREDFTIRTMPARLRAVGDLWKGLRTSKGVDLSKISRYESQRGARSPRRT
jgi:bifunctional non-homologous end joining protein LigD